MKSGDCGKCPICKIVGLLVVIGALNWGSVGLLKLNLVNQLLGSVPIAERVVYILVGIAGLLALVMCFKACPCAKPKECK